MAKFKTFRNVNGAEIDAEDMREILVNFIHDECGDNVSEAARKLDVFPTQLYMILNNNRSVPEAISKQFGFEKKNVTVYKHEG